LERTSFSLVKHFRSFFFVFDINTCVSHEPTKDLTEELQKVAAGYVKFGGIPRLIFKNLLGDGVEGWDDAERIYEDSVKEKVLGLLRIHPHANSADTSRFKESASHSVIALRPKGKTSSTGCKRMISRASEKVVTTHYLQYLVAEAGVTQDISVTRQFYRALCGNPLMRQSAGYVFEAMVHRLIRKGGKIAPKRAFTGSNKDLVETVARRDYSFKYLKELEPLLRAAKNTQLFETKMLDTYFRPTANTLESIDAFVVTKPKGRDEKVVLLQMTIARAHPIKTDGLDDLWKIIPHQARKNGFLFVFAMPEDEPDCGVQKLVGAPAKVALWEKRIQQAVWKIPNDQLWAAN
jgi:hypothetical protein